MPMYQTQCQACGRQDMVFRKIAERDDLPTCGVCSGVLQRILSAPAIFREFEPYISPASGKVITSRNQRREDLLATGSIEYEKGIKEQIARKKAELYEEDLAKVDKIVDDVVCALNVSGRLDNAES